jgi:hypothetical protein
VSSKEAEMKTAAEAWQAHVVRGRGGRVIVIFWGDDAESEAESWAARGYEVQPTDRALVAV